MGFWKNQMFEEEERRWRSHGENLVCDDCCQEAFLRSVIRKTGSPGSCSYCERDTPNVVLADDIMSLIGDGLRSGWGDPLGEMFWDQEDQRYWGETMSPDEVLWDAGMEGSDEFIEAVARSLTLDEWCRHNPYNLSFDEILIEGGEEFEKLIREETRFFFLKDPAQRNYVDPDSILPAHLLEEMGRAVLVAELIKVLPRGTRIVRGRAHSPEEFPTTVSELGAPPRDAAKYSNRMSPSGIVMFYGSLDEETAREEAARNQHVVTTAEFEVTQDIPVIDFTEIPPVPSVFDPRERSKITPISFMQKFAERLSQPVVLDGREHVDYVPTQVVTEYFRRVLPVEHEVSVEGILYKSSLGSGASCVFFADASNCGTLPEDTNSPRKMATP